MLYVDWEKIVNKSDNLILDSFQELKESFDSRVFDSLSKRESIIFYKFAILDMDYDEISKETYSTHENKIQSFTIKPKTVKSYVRSAINKIKKISESLDLYNEDLLNDTWCYI